MELEGISTENFCYLNSNATGPNFLAIQKSPNNPLSFDKNQLKGHWQFGYLSYDLKNNFEELESNNHSNFQFKDRYFFSPDSLIIIENGEKTDLIGEFDFNKERGLFKTKHEFPKLEQQCSKEEYFAHFDRIHYHIKRGDIYELNFCICWSAVSARINPFSTYQKLNDKTKAPFSALCKFGSNYIICGSPERFIKKQGDKIISQPIKGTAKRAKSIEIDNEIRNALLANKKESAENVMATDVVRNDFSKFAKNSSVKVSRLAELHSFETVHHLISTVEAEIKPNVEFDEIVESCFPMASMTGAPKISAMKIIEREENFKRGLYSGSIGYLDNQGNFDFNVVIRSILYNQETGHLTIPVGSAITYNSDPLQEYEECLLKAEAMIEALK